MANGLLDRREMRPEPLRPRCSSALRSLFGCVWTRNHRSFPSSAKVLSAQNANAIPPVPLASVGLPTKLPHLLIVRPPSPAEFTCEPQG